MENRASCCQASAFVHGLEGAVAAPTRNVETLLQVESVTCSACVARVGSALGAVPGVSEARLNLATRRARIVHDEHLSFDDLIRTSHIEIPLDPDKLVQGFQIWDQRVGANKLK